MRQRKFYLISLIILGILLITNPNDTMALHPGGDGEKEETQKYVSGEVIIKLKETKNPDTFFSKPYSERSAKHANVLSRLKSQYKLRDEKPVFQVLHDQLKAKNTTQAQLQAQIEAKFPKRTKPKDTKRVDLFPLYILKTDKDVLETCYYLSGEHDVEYAEPNYLYSTNTTTPNDPLYSVQWPLNNTGQDYPASGNYNSPHGTPDCDIDAPEAWDITTGSSDVIVAVIDTGVDYDHRDLTANMWVNQAELNGVEEEDDDGNGYIDDIYGYDFYNNDSDPIDDHGHGTHVSGIIAAEGNNGLDIAGVCWNAKVMALKFLGSAGGGDAADAVNAFYYSVENGADILSNSWGGGGYSETMEEAINYAYTQGVVMLASAGNTGRTDPNYPAYFENVIAVAATNSNDEKASFSTYGSWVEIAAPGVDILSLRADGTSMGYVYDDHTTIASGTSMACPHAAGVAALALSKNPALTNDEIRAILQISSDDIGEPGKDGLGYGRLNAHRVCSMGSVLISITSPEDQSYVHEELVYIEGNAFMEEDFFGEYKLYYAAIEDPTQRIQIPSYSTEPVQNSILAIWDTNICGDGEYILTLKLISNEGRELERSINLTIDNYHEPPVCDINGIIAVIDRPLEYKVEARDPDDPETPWGQLSYSVEGLPPGAEFNAETQILSWTPLEADKGVYELSITVSDIAGGHTITKIVPLYTLYIEETRIDTTDDPDSLAIYEDTIVWSARHINGQDGDDIFMYDLFSEQETRITDDSWHQSSATIYDDIVLWKDHRDRNNDIYICNKFRPEVKKNITKTPGWDDFNASIYGDKIVWNSDIEAIYMHNLSTGENIELSNDSFNPLPVAYVEILPESRPILLKFKV